MTNQTSQAEFLPEKYEVPQSNANYMKLKKGENRFRILSKPIIGWLDWKDKKPLHFRMKDKPDAPVDPSKKIKHFWAFVVWNYTDNNIQILEITQSSIQSALQNLTKDADWGAPYGYDIKVIKSGDGMETEYAINPVPHKSLGETIVHAFNEKPCDLEKLYDAEDPFDVQEIVTEIQDLPF